MSDGMNNRSDPTQNTLRLIDVTVTGLTEWFKAETRRVDERFAMFSERMKDMSVAESKRLDSIREVDAQAVRVASDRAIEQAAVLANQVATSAETLRGLVATTATTVAINMQQQGSQLADRIEEGQKNQNQRDDMALARIAALEKAQNEGAGRAGMTVAMPAQVQALQTALAKAEGRQGISIQLVVAIALIVGGIIVYIVESLMGVP